MPIKNLVGQKFGHLTVIKLSEKRHPKNNKILWECQCDCGNDEIIYATTGNLTQGYKTSCGCAKKAQFKQVQENKIKDLSNQKFGKLTALYRIEGTSPPVWKCICDCGTEINVVSTMLLQGKRTSCGCGRKELRKNLVGMKFGRLTVIEQAENYVSPSGQSQIQYKCKCDCGGEITVIASSLQQGLTQSCGCLRSAGEMVVANYLREKNIKFIQEYRFIDCKDDRPLPFDFCILNDDDTIKLLIEINGKQHYEPRYSNDIQTSQAIFEKQKQHDLIKEKYCIEHNIDLLIIPYYELNNYKQIIDERIK